MKQREPRKGIPAVLASARRVLGRHGSMARLIRAIRALIHFGPWRHAARAFIRMTRPARVIEAHPTGSLLPVSNIDEIVAAVRTDSVCVLGQLRADVVEELRNLTADLPPNEYANFHHFNASAAALVNDPGVLAVARKYFGSEPVLLECNLVVGEAEDPARPLPPTSQRRFHFDYAGWQSLNLFTFFTEVSADSGAHEVVAGTHRAKTMRDAVQPSFSDEEIARRFGDRVRLIAGPAGTMFFEDTEAFHRRRMIRHRRVMLNILFASHRGVFSRGRLTRTHEKLLRQRLQPAEGEAASRARRLAAR